MQMTKVRGRFAPSPSGEMHLGNAWAALLAWLDVRHLGGTMVLRMEDLDPDRCRPYYGIQVMEDMAWLGLDWDEGPDKGGSFSPYTQSERRDCYEAALQKLVDKELVYPCYCSRGELKLITTAPHGTEGERVYPGVCRNRRREKTDRAPSWRIQVPETEIAFVNGVYGEYRQNIAGECGDFIVRRADGVHAYQLAVVVDDGMMEINRILRGSDLLSSTPRQIFLYRLLDYSVPDFVHVPLLYGPDGHRLSKRHQAVSLAALRQRGVPAERIVGFLAWKAGLISRNEPVAPRQLIEEYDVSKLSRSAVVVGGHELL